MESLKTDIHWQPTGRPALTVFKAIQSLGAPFGTGKDGLKLKGV